jgi:hypothetical protein
MAINNGTMMLHRGGQYVSREDLALIPLPDETATFKPMPHNELANRVITISNDLLRGFTLTRETYGVNRQGAQMFALLAYYQTSNPERGISVAFRNSLDKSMAIGVCLGINVFVCDNMAMHGDISVMRKHTSNMFADLENMLISTTYKANDKYLALDTSLRGMQDIALTDVQAFGLAGNLFAKGIVSPRQLPVLIDQWNKPNHVEFQPRSLYSLYNDVTEALKTSPPDEILERHIELHNFLGTPGNLVDIIPEYKVL